MELLGNQNLIISSDDPWVGERFDHFLNDYLKRNMPDLGLSRSFLSKYIPEGVYINGTAAKNSHQLKAGDTVDIDLGVLATFIGKKHSEDNVETPPTKGNLDIVEETDDWIVLRKPAGVAVHPSKGNIDNTLANYVKYYLEQKHCEIKGLERGGVVHRLDKPVSGLMLFAKTVKFQKYIMNQFSEKLVSKRYLATIEPLNGKVQLVKEGDTRLIEGYMERDPGMRYRRVFNISGEGKYSSTEITLLKGNLANIIIYTGRTHQIRATLRYLGYVVVGDELYGASTKYDDGHIDLKCVYLKFHDMSGVVKTFEITL